MSDLFDNPAALTDFLDDTAIFTGERREDGAAAARSLSLTVRCSLFGGDPSQTPSAAHSPSAGLDYTLLILRADWPEHLPPQRADTVTLSSLPRQTLRVLSASPFGLDAWLVNCQTREART